MAYFYIRVLYKSGIYDERSYTPKAVCYIAGQLSIGVMPK